MSIIVSVISQTVRQSQLHNTQYLLCRQRGSAQSSEAENTAEPVLKAEMKGKEGLVSKKKAFRTAAVASLVSSTASARLRKTPKYLRVGQPLFPLEVSALTEGLRIFDRSRSSR